MVKSLLRKTEGGSSGADIFIFGLMILLVVIVFNVITNVHNVSIKRKDMIDENLTLSLLSVDLADMSILGDTNVITISGGNEDLIRRFISSVSTNFSDEDGNNTDLRVTNKKLFGENGYMIIQEIVIVNKGSVAEWCEVAPNVGEPKFGTYTMNVSHYKLASANTSDYRVENLLTGVQSDCSIDTSGGYEGLGWQVGSVRYRDISTEEEGEWSNYEIIEMGDMPLKANYVLGGSTYNGVTDPQIGVVVSLHFDNGGWRNIFGSGMNEDGTRNNNTGFDGNASRTRIVALKVNKGA